MLVGERWVLVYGKMIQSLRTFLFVVIRNHGISQAKEMVRVTGLTRGGLHIRNCFSRCVAQKQSQNYLPLNGKGHLHSGFLHFLSKDLAMPLQPYWVKSTIIIKIISEFGFICSPTGHNLQDSPIVLVTKSLHIEKCQTSLHRTLFSS